MGIVWMLNVRRTRALCLSAVLAWLAAAPIVAAQGATPKPPPLWGRVSFFANTSGASGSTPGDRTLSELIGTVTFESRGPESDRVEYRADVRLSGFPADGNRPRRASVYDAWIGLRWKSGQVGLRAGQMWVNDLGGLGALAGALFEVRQTARKGRGRWRAAIFGGLEPKIMELGYAPDVTKAGALVAFDGAGLRRHVLGFVGVRDRGTAERSVLMTTNLLPLGKRVFIYQAAEYDLAGPGAGAGASRLTYFFSNARITPSSRVELQGTYHRGRSVDVRTLVRDQLDGKPIDPRMIDGLRFESLTGRLTLTLVPGLRLFGSYGRDTNNRDEQSSDRVSYGLFVSNLLGSGIDLTGSDSRMSRGPGGSYHSWYASMGRSLGSRLYVTADYGSSLSVFRFVAFNGFTIENRPHTRRASLSGILNLPGGISWLATAERVTLDERSQIRVLSGVTYRF